MKILGFGDSFITPCQSLSYTYINQVADHFNGTAEARGLEGTGSWDAFFQFQKNTDPFDVAIFVWSNATRLYHPTVRGICHGSAHGTHKNSNDPVWEAARAYYSHLFDNTKAEIELSAFCHWFDDYLLKNYPNKKFIHLSGFTKYPPEKNFWSIAKQSPNELQYYHDWKNSVEIRPALIHLSTLEGWPEDNDLSGEKRAHHMTPNVHTILAKAIINAIENYEPGKIFTSVNI